MLASQPDDRTETQYMSKYFTYFDLSNSIYGDLNIGGIEENISNLYDTMTPMSGFLCNWVITDSGSNPFILSNLRQGLTSDSEGHLSIGILSASGYRLSTALANVLPQNTVGCPNGEYISSVTTAGGKVIAVGSNKLSDEVGAVVYSDFSKSSGNADNDHFERIDLHIMKLKEQQLSNLIENNMIKKDYLYMTIDG